MSDPQGIKWDTIPDGVEYKFDSPNYKSQNKMDSTGKKLIQTLAKRFAYAMWMEVGTRRLIEIDQKNDSASHRTSKVCASHHYADSNMTMNQVFKDSGLGDASQPHMHDRDELWEMVWNYTKAVSFCRLRGIRHDDDYPTIRPACRLAGEEMLIDLPGIVDMPVIVAVDYYGTNPRMQIMHYESDNDEPQVHVRYDAAGKIQEVEIANGDIVVTRGDLPRIQGTWLVTRDSLAACKEGDLLKMPSGQFAEVMRLQNRYPDYDSYVRYDEVYQVAKRLLESRTGTQIRGMLPGTAIGDLWVKNPLTAATTDPSDMSLVLEDKSELPDPAVVLGIQSQP